MGLHLCLPIRRTLSARCPRPATSIRCESRCNCERLRPIPRAGNTGPFGWKEKRIGRTRMARGKPPTCFRGPGCKGTRPGPALPVFPTWEWEEALLPSFFLFCRTFRRTARGWFCLLASRFLYKIYFGCPRCYPWYRRPFAKEDHPAIA